MDQPDIPQLKSLLASVEELRTAEVQLQAARERANNETLKLAEITNKKERIQAALYAYWFAPELNANTIGFAATGRNHPAALLKHAGPMSVGIPCDKCHGDLPIYSRSHMKEMLDKVRFNAPTYAEGYRVLCNDCIGDVFQKRHDEAEAREQQVEARAIELRRMSYGAYLETDEWFAARDRHVRELVQEQDDAPGCEVCGSHEKRGIFHRSLDNLGLDDDLILLCTACKTALEKSGKIAGEPGENNFVSDTHIGIITGTSRANNRWLGIDDEA